MPANGRWDLIRRLKVKVISINENEMVGTHIMHVGDVENM